MATSFSLEHEFPLISQEKFESYLNDPKLNDMLKKALDFDERKLISKEEIMPKEIIEWRFLVRKKGNFPKALESVLKGNGFAWFETSRFVKKEHCIYWKIEPENKGLKVYGEGKWLLKKVKDGTKRVIEGSVSVNIPLVGKVLEGIIVNELKKSFEKEPEVQLKFYTSIK